MHRRPRIALVGGNSLQGREIRDVFKESDLDAELVLIAGDDDEASILTEQDGEAALIHSRIQEQVADAGIVILAGARESAGRALEAGGGAGIIDLIYFCEDHSRGRLRAPTVEPEALEIPEGSIHVVAHPAAISIALFLGRVQVCLPVERCLVHVFEPASERGREGVTELQQQTVSLLSFKKFEKTVFDEQIGFNMLARYGADAPEALEDVESRIERHTAALLSSSGLAAMPSLRLIQVPVFHGHCFSFWVEFCERPELDQLEEFLASDLIDVRGAGFEPPSNVGWAGQSGLAVGAISRDPKCPNACWFWVVSDNLRITADNALGVARQLL